MSKVIEMRYALAAIMLTGSIGTAGANDFPETRNSLSLEPIGTYATGVFDGSAAEIAAFDPTTKRVFVVNAEANAVDVLDIRNPRRLTLLFSIEMAPYGTVTNSVDVDRNVVAIAVENEVKTDPGRAVFFNVNGRYLSDVTVGALPDMLTFTPNGRKLLVANEGEPDDTYTVDPEGSVSIVDLRGNVRALSQRQVTTANFRRFNRADIDPDIRIFGPGASVAQDLEPEYIAISQDSRAAWVSLQESNALALLDIEAGRIDKLIALGFKDHSQARNALDASNEDGGINIESWPIRGMYQPDAIAAYSTRGESYIVTANEGDARDYDGFSEETTVGELVLDPAVFPDAAELQLPENLGVLTTTTATGDANNNGVFEEIYAFGARSFSIRDARGKLIYDSGVEFERITARLLPDEFNSDNTENDSFDDRSDAKGPEPEGVDIGRAFGRQYAFIGLERVGGIMVYDISDPRDVRFVDYVNNRDFDGDAEAGTAGDLGPEGVLFISSGDSPINVPLLIVANEVSGTTTVFRINREQD